MQPKFKFGQVSVVISDWDLYEKHGINVGLLLLRHASGDWGNVPMADRKKNDKNLVLGGQLLSVYREQGRCILILTQADRGQTTVTVV